MVNKGLLVVPKAEKNVLKTYEPVSLFKCFMVGKDSAQSPVSFSPFLTTPVPVKLLASESMHEIIR